MASGSIFTILFALAFGGLLVFGYMNEEKVIEFEDRMAEKIGMAIVAHRKSRKAQQVKVSEKAVSVPELNLAPVSPKAPKNPTRSGRAA